MACSCSVPRLPVVLLLGMASMSGEWEAGAAAVAAAAATPTAPHGISPGCLAVWGTVACRQHTDSECITCGERILDVMKRHTASQADASNTVGLQFRKECGPCRNPLPRVELPANTLPLVWSDEFDGSALDTSKWVYDLGTGQDGWGNQELQAYSRDAVAVWNGSLVITASLSEGGFAQYDSGRIKTRGRADWRYGRVEVRARLPAGKGTWPAIWMRPSDDHRRWPASGEIDIMEHVGHDPNVIHGSLHTASAYGANPITECASIATAANLWCTTQAPGLPDATTEYHVYTILWNQSCIEWFVDSERFSVSCAAEERTLDTWPFDKEFYLLLNLAIGGTWGGQHGVDDSIFPAQLEVDYVRVYQDPSITPTPGATPSPYAPPPGITVPPACLPLWDVMACSASRSGCYTCGERVTWSLSVMQDATPQAAMARIAAEFPSACGGLRGCGSHPDATPLPYITQGPAGDIWCRSHDDCRAYDAEARCLWEAATCVCSKGFSHAVDEATGRSAGICVTPATEGYDTLAVSWNADCTAYSVSMDAMLRSLAEEVTGGVSTALLTACGSLHVMVRVGRVPVAELATKGLMAEVTRVLAEPRFAELRGELGDPVWAGLGSRARVVCSIDYALEVVQLGAGGSRCHAVACAQGSTLQDGVCLVSLVAPQSHAGEPVSLVAAVAVFGALCAVLVGSVVVLVAVRLRAVKKEGSCSGGGGCRGGAPPPLGPRKVNFGSGVVPAAAPLPRATPPHDGPPLEARQSYSIGGVSRAVRPAERGVLPPQLCSAVSLEIRSNEYSEAEVQGSHEGGEEEEEERDVEMSEPDAGGEDGDGDDDLDGSRLSTAS